MSRASIQVVLITAALLLASVAGMGFPDGP